MRRVYYSRRLEDNPGPLRLLLANVHHAAVGTPIRHYWEGLALADTGTYGSYVFSHEGPGTSYSDRWEWTPSTPGTFRLMLKDSVGGRVTQQIVVRAAEGSGSVVTLMTGDSITAGGGPQVYPALTRGRLIAAGCSVTMVGGQQGSPSPQPNVYHEGFPGRTYQWFVDGTPASTDVPPYRFGGVLDVAQYLATHETPNTVIFALGTNDVGNNRLDHLEVDTDEDVGNARTLLNQFLMALPDVQLGIFLTYNPSHIDAAWSGTTSYQYRQKHRRFIEKMVAEFASEVADGTVLFLDTHTATPTSDLIDHVHLNGNGHEKVTDVVWPWALGRAA